MSEYFVVFHKKEPGSNDLALPKGFYHMATCLRSIVFAWDSQYETPVSLKNYESFKGEQAYEFILKIICGLESPMIGETEIFGQFKNFIKDNEAQLNKDLKTVFNKLLTDTKKIRSEYLQNLGCTSYGSLLRKHLKNTEPDLYILGAGSLAQDIFPWFAKKSNAVRAFTKNPEKYQELVSQQLNLSIETYQPIQPNKNSVLIIAAPLSSEKINSLCQLNDYQMIYDLRADSHEDFLNNQNVVSLKTLFADLEKNRQQAMKIKESAMAAIQNKASIFNHIEKPRPFGWEDLWTYA